MDNLAYLHVAFAYEDSPSSELISLSSLLKDAAAPDWKRLSGKAWKYLLPLVLTVSVLSSVTSALALERGDQGPSVRNLQRKLQSAGYYQAPVTQVFDFNTEDAVRRFQKSVGLPVDGVADTTTLQKLEGKRKSSGNAQVTKPWNTNTTRVQTVSYTNASQAEKYSTVNFSSSKRRDPNLLQKGDEGESVRVLQERLRVAGFYYGQSTGIYGPITEEAVKRFQEAYNLQVDGVVGPMTLSKLPAASVGYGEETTTAVKSEQNRKNLSVGDRGEPVRLLQEQLIKAGYLQGEPNGYFGPYTADAVRRFQADNYLKASGVAGPTTRSKLHRAVSSATKSEFNVLEIQTRLRERGFYKGPLNGVMGKETKRAIRQAQEFYGISLSDVKSGSF